jgi:serine/threonine-protein kinase RsbW
MSKGPAQGGDVTDEIGLEIPARADLLQLVRFTAGVVAARASLGLDDVEDLRLAAEELCLSLLGPTGDAPGRLALRYGWGDEMIEITCTLITEALPDREAGAGPAGDVEGQDEGLARELSSQILDALVDEHGQSGADAGRQVWLRMRRARPPQASTTS